MSIEEWVNTPFLHQVVYMRGMNEHLKQEAQIRAAATQGATPTPNEDSGYNQGRDRDSQQVSGDITDLQ